METTAKQLNTQTSTLVINKKNLDEEIYRCHRCGEEKFGIDMRHYAGHPTHICKDCYHGGWKKGQGKKNNEPVVKGSTEPNKIERVTHNEHTYAKVYTDASLARFSPRQLMDELSARGYHGELKYTKVVKL